MSYLTDSNIIFTRKLKSQNFFALTGELGQVHMVKRNIYNLPPCGKLLIFVTEFVTVLKISKQNELEENGFSQSAYNYNMYIIE